MAAHDQVRTGVSAVQAADRLETSAGARADDRVITYLQAPLRRGFDAAERALDRLFGPSLNPLAQIGALGFFMLWIVAVSGVYLFVVFDTGVEGAYGSVEWFTTRHWWHAGLMRSFHRYASDLMVLFMVVHLLREFSLDRYRGKRFFSWVTGVPIIWFVYVSGITGYWLVWDKLAQYVAVTSTELLDWIPIFGEPIARNFLAPGSLSDRFFTLLVFLHIAVPLILLLVLWIHVQRITRPKVNPPWVLAVIIFLALLAVSLWKPAVSQGPANLAAIPSPVGLDWFYLPLYPLADRSPGALWGLLAAVSAMLVAMPWLPPMRRVRVAEVDLPHCNGCGRCVADCPYEALRLVPRTDELPYATEVAVDPVKCVSCGICMGSCPSSTPFRRSEELRTGIDLPDMPLVAVRERTREVAAGLGKRPRLLIIGCEHGAASAYGGPVLELPCVAMAPPSLVDYILSRDLADGVAIAGCRENSCYNRLGVEWTKQRVAGARDPYLRARVPRERIVMIWASPFEVARFAAEISAFKDRLVALPSPFKPTANSAAPPVDKVAAATNS
jgi:ferredoxin/coenzyme F420-reducing hydrogenase delta subunit